jgi:hypothetical protein
MIGKNRFVPSTPFILRLSKERTVLRIGLSLSKDARIVQR